MTQICLILMKALWMSRMLGRHLSRSNLTTSLRCGWLFVMAVKILPKHKWRWQSMWCLKGPKHLSKASHTGISEWCKGFAVPLINLPLLYWITYAGHANKSTSIWMIPAPMLQRYSFIMSQQINLLSEKKGAWLVILLDTTWKWKIIITLLQNESKVVPKTKAKLIKKFLSKMKEIPNLTEM